MGVSPPVAAWCSSSSSGFSLLVAKDGIQQQNRVVCSAFARGKLAGSMDEHLEPLRERYAALLRQCGESGAVQDGKSIHEKIVSCGLNWDVFLVNLIIQMYGKCGSLDDARAVFEGMPRRNVFSWNIMIAAYAQNGHYRDALDLHKAMNCEPNRLTFINVFGACSSLGDLAEGKAVHLRIDPRLIESDVVLGTALVDMYAKCGSLEDARNVFGRMQGRDGVCWNVMIAAFAQQGHYRKALELFGQMNLEGVEPTKATLLGVVAVCSSLRDLALGKAIHQRVLATGFDSNLIMMNSLVTMFGKCGSIEDSLSLFNSMPTRDVVSWNAMVAAYAQLGHYKDAFKLCQKMDLEGCKFNEVTFIGILGACSRQDTLTEGEKIHARIVAVGCQGDVVVGTALINMYAKCGKLDFAADAFDKLQGKCVVSYNAMITAYIQHERATEALQLYKEMQERNVRPDKVTFINLLEACTSLESLAEGKRIHACIAAHKLDSDDLVATMLVDMYGSCGSLEDAKHTFAKLQGGNVSVWNAMVAAYAHNGHEREAFHLLRRMDCEGVKADEITFISLLSSCSCLDDVEEGVKIHERVLMYGFESVVTTTALANMYGKCGDLSNAKRVFEKMHKRDVVSWNAIISAYAQQGHIKDCIKLLSQMDLEGMQPNEVTFATVIGACSSSGGLFDAKMIQDLAVARGFKSCKIEICLVHMYGKCGIPNEAREVFDNMDKSNLVAWNAMAAAYAQHGHSNEAFCLFPQISQEGLEPNDVTFLSILYACTHAGSLAKARSYFVDMVGDYHVVATAEHYGCMIDLLGRAGWLEQAEELMKNMPFEPDAMVWTSLLNASKLHFHVKLGEHAARSVIELDPGKAAPYVLLSNIYSARTTRCFNEQIEDST